MESKLLPLNCWAKSLMPAKLIALIVFCTACLLTGCTGRSGFTDGTWRATLKTDSGIEIPFNFTVTDSLGRKFVHITNADEHIEVEDVSVKENRVVMKLPFYDSEIRARLTSGGLEGEWIKHLGTEDRKMPFNAVPDTEWRFSKDDNQGTDVNIQGRWSAVFTGKDTTRTSIAIGEFMQDGNRVTGTFLTTTGDYRYLQGTINNNTLYLSSFDGSQANLFTATIQDSSLTNGRFYSGASHQETWTASRDDKAMLPDAYSLTSLKPGYKTINFSFPDLMGNKVSLKDKAFKNKVVIVQFLGTWCPNCIDETNYLKSFDKRYKLKGVEVVALAYERTNNVARSRALVEQLKKRLHVTYPLLVTGYTNKEVLKSLPQLADFKAFPTTVIIDKKGQVRRIHTGFSGPGTGKHYTDYIRNFELLINKLLAE